MRILAGDIGGTNSRLAVFKIRPDGLELMFQNVFSSTEFESLADVVSEFLSGAGGDCDALCLGLPGPISSENIFPLTNLPWVVDRERLRRVAGTDRIVLVNDVEAAASGLSGLAGDDVRCLQPGRPDIGGIRAVISVGTGLGVGGITSAGRAFATEAGHATFSPKNEFDIAFWRELQQEFGHVSWERVASGPALPRIHAFLSGSKVSPLEASEIVARSEGDEICFQTVETLRRYVGAAAGNIALTLMATGGVYFAGGVAPKILAGDGADQMLETFRAKGRMGPLLELIPVHLVLDDTLALRGAAATAAGLVGS